MNEIIETDVLIIGAGIAGLTAAIKLIESGISVVIACKNVIDESNTHYAQGGIAASPEVAASIESHIDDTLRAGAGLANSEVANEIISSSWKLIQFLDDHGVTFDRSAADGFSLAREGGHSTARIYHNKDATGLSICHGLINNLKTLPKQKGLLKILEKFFAAELIMKDSHCRGAELVELSSSSKEQSVKRVLAKHVILASGGIGQIFNRTTNPIIATGDGIALAYRAGAELIDLEFVQFHPTALYLQERSTVPAFLISEAIRGAGATLLDHNQVRFMSKFHPAAELATRDIIAQSMHKIMEETGQKYVYIDLRPIGKTALEEKFPHILAHLKSCGIDALKEPVPISPAAHYFMGGIKADCTGRTSIPDLYAIGECACTGFHGANRLASNSLLEAGVMGLAVADFIYQTKNDPHHIKANDKPPFSPSSQVVPADLLAMRKLMFDKMGVVRDGASLQEALKYLTNSVKTTGFTVEAAQAANMLLLAQLIGESALTREESRGSHFRRDYPKSELKFAKRQMVSRSSRELIEIF